MGTSVSTYIRKKGTNPFADAIGRNEAGELTVDIDRVLSLTGTTALYRYQVYRNQVDALKKALGSGPVRASDLENFGFSEQRTTGGDSDIPYTYTWRPLKNLYTKQAYRSAVEAFKIKEQGQQEAARIAQEGRDRARQANFGAELEAVNRRALAAAEDNAYEQRGGTPDVVLSSDTDIDDAPAGQGVNARRRRSAFSGGGLRI